MRLTTSPPSSAECHEIWEPKPPGTLWATPGLLRDSFTFISLTSTPDARGWLTQRPVGGGKRLPTSKQIKTSIISNT